MYIHPKCCGCICVCNTERLLLHLKENLCDVLWYMSTCWMGKELCPQVGVQGWFLYTGILYPGSASSGRAGWVITCTYPDHEMPFSLPFPDIWLLPPFLLSWGLPSFSLICFKWVFAAGCLEWVLKRPSHEHPFPWAVGLLSAWGVSAGATETSPRGLCDSKALTDIPAEISPCLSASFRPCSLPALGLGMQPEFPLERGNSQLQN